MWIQKILFLSASACVAAFFLSLQERYSRLPPETRISLAVQPRFEPGSLSGGLPPEVRRHGSVPAPVRRHNKSFPCVRRIICISEF